MAIGKSFRYAPGSLIGHPNERLNIFSRKSWVHASIPSGSGYQLCSCGLMASTLEGNRGHRDSMTGELTSKGFFAQWEAGSTGIPRELRRAAYSCFCGEPIYGDVEIPLLDWIEPFEPHDCQPLGKGPAEWDARTRAVEALRREIFFTYQDLQFRLGEKSPKTKHSTAPLAETAAIIFGYSGFPEALSNMGSPFGYSYSIPRVEVEIGGAGGTSECLIFEDEKLLPQLLRHLDQSSTEVGLDGYLVYRHGKLTQRPVLTPEFSLKADKSLVSIG
jgi:hypothetical protein